MKKGMFIRLLAAFAHLLERGQRGEADRSSQEHTLLGLAEEIRGILEPVKPATSFREDLARRLDMVAEKRVVVESQREWRRTLLLAALGSLISLMGVMTYFLYSRLSHRAQPTA